MDRHATMVTYMGSFSAFLGGLGLNQIIAMLGLILAIATFFVNWFYKSQHLKLARDQAKAKLKVIANV